MKLVVEEVDSPKSDIDSIPERLKGERGDDPSPPLP
jgi:hypothetical protein